MEDCNSNTPHGESGQVDPGQPGQKHWEAAMELQGRTREMEARYGVNSQQARDMHAAAAAERAAAIAEGYQMTGQGQRLPGFDRRR